MGDQCLEFATLSLKDGVAATDERVRSVFRRCIPEIQAAGGEHFRFLLSSPSNKDLDRTLLGMAGIWPTDEMHSKFLERGAIMPLLVGLDDLISLKDMVYLKVPDLRPEQIHALGQNISSGLFDVDGTERAGFEKTAGSVMHDRGDAVAAWNVTDQASMARSKEVCKDILPADQKEFEHGGTWGILVADPSGEVIEGIRRKAEGRFKGVEEIRWTAYEL